MTASTSSGIDPYSLLIADRKRCAQCSKMENPSRVDGGRWDVDHVGQWTAWQRLRTADVMIVGQDWGGVTDFERGRGKEPTQNPTNETLRKLLAHVGIEIDPPEKSDGRQRVFLTNAVLCLKPGGLTAALPIHAVKQCGSFLKRTIEIVRPKVVVTLGFVPLSSVLRQFPEALAVHRHRLRRMADAIKLETAPELFAGTRLLPVYHTGYWGQKSRPFDNQLDDWKRLKGLVGISRG